MAELVDAKDSKSFDRKVMGVRFPLWAHKKHRLKGVFLFVYTKILINFYSRNIEIRTKLTVKKNLK